MELEIIDQLENQINPNEVVTLKLKYLNKKTLLFSKSMDFMPYFNLFVITNDILKTLKSYCVHPEKSIPATKEIPVLFVCHL